MSRVKNKRGETERPGNSRIRSRSCGHYKDRVGQPNEEETRRRPMKGVCCAGVFIGFVEVPDEAGLGTATITYSYEAWSGGR